MSGEENTPEAKKQIVASVLDTPALQHFVYPGQDAEEKMLVKKINGNLAVISDQTKYLNHSFPWDIKHGDNRRILIQWFELRVPSFEIQLLNLPARVYTWIELSLLIQNLAVSKQKQALEDVLHQTESHCVELGKLHTACLKLDGELKRLFPRVDRQFPQQNYTSRSTQLDRTFAQETRLVYYHVNSFTSGSYIKFAKAAASILETFEFPQ